ncbi:hypothetical protein, partial [Salinispora arenicola]|uniref:hypothetical protein n=1 Tax=Salinispora arenicola TaxID=168697 RepID=UPI0027DDC669
MVPVDFVSAAIAEAGRRPDAVGRILHLVNPDPPSFADLRRGFALAGPPGGVGRHAGLVRRTRRPRLGHR